MACLFSILFCELHCTLSIQEYSKYDKISMDIEQLKRIAASLPKNKMGGDIFNLEDYLGGEQ